MSPMDAVTGEHEEEDGSDHHDSAHLPPQQHGCTDDGQAAGGQHGCVKLSINCWACYVSMFGLSSRQFPLVCQLSTQLHLHQACVGLPVPGAELLSDWWRQIYSCTCVKHTDEHVVVDENSLMTNWSISYKLSRIKNKLKVKLKCLSQIKVAGDKIIATLLNIVCKNTRNNISWQTFAIINDPTQTA